MKFAKSSLLTVVIRWLLLTSTFLIISIHSSEDPASSDEPTKPSQPEATNGKNLKFNTFAQSMKQSRNRGGSGSENVNTLQEQWEQALQEIKDLAVPRSSFGGPDSKMNEKSLFRRWRSLLNEPTKIELDPKTKMLLNPPTKLGADPNANTTMATTERDNAFASWERILQDWADDVQDYMEKIEAESKQGYPMSQFGNAEKSQLLVQGETEEKSKETPMDTVEDVDSEKSQSIDSSKKKPISLPVPFPRKDGEDVLPYTDISDKSKRILIVTTASLPWMTGTAVNPLLRAAYMTTGRSEAGGSVTLMLPWLERKQDQEQVYGANRMFERPEEQEVFIRKWLRESAKFPRASEELNIKWYTAWQNKVENSVYSMGDITALIPRDEVDICILEEPEHLNWYRAPGESWTDKFKHVVGIIHTNYFVYAQDQPAAFVRVSYRGVSKMFFKHNFRVWFVLLFSAYIQFYSWIIIYKGTSDAPPVLLDVSRTLPSYNQTVGHTWTICTRKGIGRKRTWHPRKFPGSRKGGQQTHPSISKRRSHIWR